MRKIRMGMVGGGRGAFIGAVHRLAANLDGQIELSCGAFSSDPELSRASGAELGLAAECCYDNYQHMMEAEAALPPSERMDFVAIVTPNHLHLPVAKAALKHGFHVLSDKPATLSLAEARELAQIVDNSGLLYGLTHTYTGYPLIKQARHLVASGALGTLRKVVVEYPQGWLATSLESQGHKQAEWRADPKRSGPAGAMGDIGTHAAQLAEHVSGLNIAELAADLSRFVEGRRLDDDGNILLRFEGGAKGLLHASQICVGEENNLNLRIWGTEAGLEWHQREPNSLIFKSNQGPAQIYRAGQDYLCELALACSRTPPAHPEGYIEAFANIYRAFAAHIGCRLDGREPEAWVLDYPGIRDGLRGMAFVEAAVDSSARNSAWTRLIC